MVSVQQRTVRKDVIRNRQLLLDSADAMIRENGMDLSLNAVAHHAGVGVGTVYRHFPDRDALIDALFDQRIAQVEQILAAHVADDDPIAGLWAAVFEICEVQAKDRGVWELISAGRHERQRETVHERLLPVSGRLVAQANAAGRMRVPFDPYDLPIIFWMGGALNAYLGGVSEHAWRRYVQLMMDSYLADDDPVRVAIKEPALTVDEVDAAMRSWKPRAIRRD